MAAPSESTPRVFCTYCQDEILGIGAVCAVCEDLPLCLKCLACGAEMGSHKRGHAYSLADRGSFPIFEGANQWQATNECDLVETVEHFGFGNWEDVAKKINASASNVADHYRAYYIDGSLGSATLPREPNPQFQTKDHSCPEGGPLSPSLTVQFPPIAIPQEEQQLLGFMPLRDDFEREYDNDAEHLLAGLEISCDDEDDDDVDSALKAAYVDMYRMRLRERIRRKNVARDFRLIENAVGTIQRKDQKKAADISKRRSSKEEKEWFDRMRIFAQIHSLHEQEKLYENLQKEKKLKNRLKELANLRKLATTKTNEISDAESSKGKREKSKGKETGGKEVASNGSVQSKKKSNSSRSTGSRSTSKNTRATASAETSSTCDTSDGEQTDEGDAGDMDTSAPPHSAPPQPPPLLGSGKTAGGGGSSRSASGKHATPVSASSSSTNGRNTDYSKFPGYDLLSHKERQLCRSISMTPSNYILIKAAILKDHCSRQNGVTVKNKYHGVEKSHRKKIIEFLATSGWITVP